MDDNTNYTLYMSFVSHNVKHICRLGELEFLYSINDYISIALFFVYIFPWLLCNHVKMGFI